MKRGAQEGNSSLSGGIQNILRLVFLRIVTGTSFLAISVHLPTQTLCGVAVEPVARAVQSKQESAFRMS